MPLLRALVAVIALPVVALGLAWLVGGQAVQVAGVPATVPVVLLAFAVNWAAFVPAAVLRTERFYDAVGSMTYLLVVLASLGLVVLAGAPLSAPAVVTAALVVCWAVRLGLFLVARIRREGGDGRFDRIKGDPARFLLVWTLQGAWVSLTALAAIVIMTDGRDPVVGIAAVLGWLLWSVGWGIEVVADRQKSAFRADPANEGRFITSGLWSLSRHPNYLGEILLWTGIFVSGAGLYTGGQWAAVISPLFVVLLLTRISGIPLLEARADKRWGDDPAYRAYRAATPVLLPKPVRRGRAAE